MNIKYNKKEALKHYDKLKFYADDRTSALSSMLGKYISVTDEYGKLVCRLTALLGSVPPQNDEERITRDLLADIFDFLYETRPFILKGKPEIAVPLARRAYESLSLLVACHFDSKVAGKWAAGKEIGNAEIRKILAQHPMGETEESTRELYKFFSKASHPNRYFVAERFLGDGNFFVLGSIGFPNLILTADLCHKIVNLWFWYVAFINFIFLKFHISIDPEFGKDYLATANNAQELSKELIENFNMLLRELKEEK